MKIPLDPARLDRALADAREWYAQLKADDDPGNADEVMRLAQERLPAVKARALRVCTDFGLPVSEFEVPVWDVIIGWRDAGWVLGRLGGIYPAGRATPQR